MSEDGRWVAATTGMPTARPRETMSRSSAENSSWSFFSPEVAEKNAKLGWRKLELQEARSALRLLPAIRAILMDGEMAAEERVARAREALMAGGGKLLVTERTED